jgi:hypothetical protein
LSDELNDILGMIFTRNPEERITVGQLKFRISQCSSFSAPTQQPQQLPTPPQSPCQVAFEPECSAPSPISFDCSDDGSISSDEGSLISSCSTLSDNTDSDSGYESMDSESYEIVDPAVGQPKVQRPVDPTPFSHLQYVLPSQQEYNPNPNFYGGAPTKPTLWPDQTQSWGNPYEQQYEQMHAVPQHVHAVYPFAHPALFPSHYQFAREAVW